MATRRKAAGKSSRKRKKTPVRKAARKTVRKTKTTGNRTAKKSSPRPAPRKRATSTVRPTPIHPPAQAGATPPIGPTRPSSQEQRIGVVTHYYSHLSVAAMQLEPVATLRVGDVIHIHGHTTDFTQRVESLEVNHASVDEVRANDDFGLKVIDHAREHDVVFKVRS
jgi:hypothetical protein